MLFRGRLKKLVAILRGEVAPVLILLSAALGFWFGVTPGWYGLHVVLLAVALILNIHVGIFLLAAGLGKSFCFAAAPLMFHVGAWVQDSLSPVLKILAGIPIIGLTDFSRYAVAGAVLIGPAIGLLLGLLLAGSVSAFRRAWLKLEGQSEALAKWRSKRWVRILDRLLIGKSVADVRAVLTRRPRMIRKVGVALAVVVVVASAIGIRWVQNDLAAKYLADALTRVNGAEVNLSDVDLKVLSGSFAASDLQVTHLENPKNNRIAVGKLSAKASLWNLLIGRVVLDEVVLSAVAFDQPRESPGKVLPGRAHSPESPSVDSARFDLEGVDAARLESYLADAEEIKAWLEKISSWVPARREAAGPESKPVPESYLGYLAARAPAQPVPRLLVKRVELDPVAIPDEQFGQSKITCLNMSDAPAAAGLPVTVEIKSNQRPMTLTIVSHYDSPDGGATIEAAFEDVDLAKLQSRLSGKNPVVFKGGTATGHIKGKVTREEIDLGITVKTAGMQAESAGGGLFGLDPRVSAEAMKVLENVETTLRIVGPVAEPRLVFDGPALRKEFKDALVSAGKDALAGQITDLVGDRLPGTAVDGKSLLEKPADVVRGLVGGLLGDRAPKKEDESKDAKPAKPSSLLDALRK